MSLRAVDEVVAWRVDARGRPVAFEGLRERHRIGPVTRLLLPDLDSGFAAPGDLVRLYRLPIKGMPIAAMVNFTRRAAATVPPYRRLAAVFPFWAAGIAADLGWALNGLGFLAGMVAGLPVILGLRLAADRARAASGAAAAYDAAVYWQIARHWAAPGAPRRSEPPDAPPDWPARLADSYRRALPSHAWAEIARLPVPDGRLIACDPYEAGDPRTGAIEVPPGIHPVVLAVGRFGPPESGLAEARVTHAWVELRAGPVARWEPARDAAGGRLDVGVDSGLASFSAAASAPALRAAYDDGSPYGFSTGLEQALETAMRTSNHAVLDAAEARLVVFESGYGDGVYDLYRGLGEDGEPVAVAIDFKVAESIYFARG